MTDRQYLQYRIGSGDAQTGYRHREPTETEKTRRKHRPDKLQCGLVQ